MKIVLDDKLAEVHKFILEKFTTSGHSPSIEEVKKRFKLEKLAEAEKLIEELEASGAIHRAPGDPHVTHAYPFSNEPTRHRVTLASGATVHAMCAVDALGIPFMLRTDAVVESVCLYCDSPIRVLIEAGMLGEHKPSELVVGYMPLDFCSTPATEQCPHINFFCAPDHFERWKREHTDKKLQLMPLEQALERGKEVFGSMLRTENGNGSNDCCHG